MNRKLERNLPILLSVVASIGVVVTSVLVGFRAEKANKNIREAKKNKDTPGIIKEFLKGYYPALISGTATVSSIIAGTVISKKMEMSLTATAIILDGTLRKYKGKLRELFGDKAEEITKSISENEYKKVADDDKKVVGNEQMYYEEHVGFFKADPEKLKEAFVNLNNNIFVKKGWGTIGELLKDCEAVVIDEEKIDNTSYEYGWLVEYLQEVYGENTDDISVKSIMQLSADEKYLFLYFNKEPLFGITNEYCSRVSDYDASELYDLSDDAAKDILFDELKYQRKVTKVAKDAKK